MPSIKIKNKTTGQWEKLPIFRQDASGGSSNHAELSNLDYEHSGHTGFQPTIDDLSEIRSGAQAGATAVQDNDYVHTDNNFSNTYKNEVDENTSAKHTHSNKQVLDDIDATDISNWNNKSDFSGNYEDLSNLPTIPKACNLGLAKNYTSSNPLNLNDLKVGTYLLENVNQDWINVKATYQGNEILGQKWLSITSAGPVFFIIEKEITDSLSTGTSIGKCAYLEIIDTTGNISYVANDIKIRTDSIDISSGTVNKIETVDRSHNQTISGVKTFNSLPVCGAVPTTNNQLVNKKYVDDTVGDINTALGNINTILENIIDGGV